MICFFFSPSPSWLPPHPARPALFASFTTKAMIFCELWFTKCCWTQLIKTKILRELKKINVSSINYTVHAGLTERFEDVGGGFIHVFPVWLVAFCAVFDPFPLLLVAGLASVASPPVVALGNMHANVHSVVTCHNTIQYTALQWTQIRLHSLGNHIHPEHC